MAVVKPTETDLEIELLSLYRQWAKLGYRASRFYQTFMGHCKSYKGGIRAATDVLWKTGTGGFERLKELGRLDLTIEKAIILNPKWTQLFNDGDRAMAQRKVNAKPK